MSKIKKKISKNINERQNTFVASARCDIRKIATIASYYIETVEVPANRSDLISSALYHLAEILIKKHGATEFKSSQKAWNYLKVYGLSGGRQTQSLKKAIEAEVGKQSMSITTDQVKNIVSKIAEKNLQK